MKKLLYLGMLTSCLGGLQAGSFSWDSLEKSIGSLFGTNETASQVAIEKVPVTTAPASQTVKGLSWDSIEDSLGSLFGMPKQEPKVAPTNTIPSQSKPAGQDGMFSWDSLEKSIGSLFGTKEAPSQVPIEKAPASATQASQGLTWDSVEDALESLFGVENVQKNQPAVEQVEQVAEQAAVAADTALQNIDSAQDLKENVNWIATDLPGQVDKYAQDVIALVPTISQYAKILSAVAQNPQFVLSLLGQFIPSAYNAVKQLINENKQTIVTMLQDSGVQKFVQQFSSGIQNLQAQLNNADSLAAKKEVIKETVKALGAQVAPQISELIDNNKKMIDQGLAVLKDVNFTDLVDQLKGF